VFDITLTADEPATTWFRLTGQGTVTAGGTDTTAGGAGAARRAMKSMKSYGMAEEDVTRLASLHC
jgi:hypothetical protein